MSGQIKLKAASLGGDITLTPTDTASNLVVTTPAGTSTLVTNATLPTQLNASGSAPIYACRAWVNFNGRGTVAIRASGNVSSITDNGVGNYTVNFTTAMQDAVYATETSMSQYLSYAVPGFASQVAAIGDKTTTSQRIYTGQATATGDVTWGALDYNEVCVTIFR
jgi:hypothetical protein